MMADHDHAETPDSVVEVGEDDDEIVYDPTIAADEDDGEQNDGDDDGTPGKGDPLVRLYVFLAQEAHRAVILRRGPSRVWMMATWNVDTDEIQRGQWLKKAQVYPEKCSVAIDGSRFAYFCVKPHGAIFAFTAVSQPPYWTAQHFSPHTNTFAGGGAFSPNGTFHELLDHRTVLPPGVTAIGPQLDPTHTEAVDQRGRAVRIDGGKLYVASAAPDEWRLLSDFTPDEFVNVAPPPQRGGRGAAARRRGANRT